MMRSLRFACFLCLLFAAPAGLLKAADLLSPTEAGRHGLVENWRRQLSAIGGSQSLVDIKLHVEGERSRAFVEVVTERDGESRVLLRVAHDQLDPFGNPIGKEEATRRARMEVLRLRNRGIEASVSENAAPQVRLYTLGADGTVEARDAESGELFWVVRYGNPRLPCGSLGVSDQFVTFINGSQVLQLSTDDGKLVHEFPMAGSPLLGSVIAGDYALVPTTRAGMEGFPLLDSELYPFLKYTAGRATAEPAVAPGSNIAAWGTDAGFVYVLEMLGEPSLTFRFNCNGNVHSQLTAASEDRFFFGTENGQVYALQATRTGKILWRRNLDQPIDESPFLDGDRLYLSTIYNRLFCLDLASGEEQWGGPASQVSAILASTDEQLFVRTTTQQLGVVGKATGAKSAAIATTIGDRYVTNRHTDRLYLLSDGGTLQCLRPVGSEMPVIKTAIKPPPTSEEPTETEAPTTPAESPEEVPATEPTEDVDPFGTGEDPFGGSGFGDVLEGDSPF